MPTIYELYLRNLKIRYAIQSYKNKSLLEWAKIWFKTDNDSFYADYGFNFNPHEYPHLYEIARDELYGGVR